MATFGTDQESMQRLLTVETRKKSQRTMLLTPIGSFLMMVIFLTVGTCLYAFYVQHPGLALPAKLDKIFPHFIGQVMPAGLRGLMLSAIVMASLESPVGSLTTSFVTDIYRPVINPWPASAIISSSPGAPWSCLPFSWRASPFSQPLRENPLAGLQNRRVTYGSLLGFFSWASSQDPLQPHQRRRHVSVRPGMLALLILSETKILPLGWTWLLLMALPDLYVGLAPGHQSGGHPGRNQRHRGRPGP